MRLVVDRVEKTGMMGLSNPKRYLTGIDWFMHSLDHINRRACGKGTTAQVVLELKDAPDADALRERLTNAVNAFAILQGRTARSLNLAPYWSAPSKRKRIRVRFDVVSASDEAGVDRLLYRDVVMPSEPGVCRYVWFRLVTAPDAAYLSMAFDHRVLDGQGAETFLDFCVQDPEQQARIAERVVQTEPAHLTQWVKKLLAGKAFNEKLWELRDISPPRCVTGARTGAVRTFRFKAMCMDGPETRHMMDTAFRQAGYLMLMPYVLANVLRTYEDVLGERLNGREHFIVPLSVSLRAPNALPATMFFNHLSFIFLDVAEGDATDVARMIATIKSQMCEQFADRFAQKSAEGLMLARILPVEIFGRVMRYYTRGNSGSLNCSVLTDTKFATSSVLGCEVSNLFHLPNPAYPPGVGAFFNVYRERFNGTLAFADDLIDPATADIFMQRLRHDLLGE